MRHIARLEASLPIVLMVKYEPQALGTLHGCGWEAWETFLLIVV